MFGVLYLEKVTYHEHEAKIRKQINMCKATQVGTRRMPVTPMAESCHPSTESEILKLAVL